MLHLCIITTLKVSFTDADDLPLSLTQLYHTLGPKVLSLIWLGLKELELLEAQCYDCSFLMLACTELTHLSLSKRNEM